MERERERTSPILTILMIAVLVAILANLYPDTVSKLLAKTEPFTNPVTIPQTVPVVLPPEKNNQPVLQIVTATPSPVLATDVPPVVVQEPTPQPVNPEPAQVVADEPQVADGRMITFVDGTMTPISGILIKHYIGQDLVKTLTNTNGQAKVYTDYIQLNGVWIDITGLSLVTVNQ